jgi:ATP-dependent DNA helicase PIF1
MINLKTLSLIDDRLQAILPHNAHSPFRGINVLLCGDFFQLPPVVGRALYSSVCTSPETIKGQQLYRSFDWTVQLV